MQIEHRFQMQEIEREKDSFFDMPARDNSGDRNRSRKVAILLKFITEVFSFRQSVACTNTFTYQSHGSQQSPGKSHLDRSELFDRLKKNVKNSGARFESREFGNSRICHYDTSGRYHKHVTTRARPSVFIHIYSYEAKRIKTGFKRHVTRRAYRQVKK